ncbi:unnamed protein product [Orchesella dallaii]|uniref:Uncharacterized protein n=1 Tax=Orchesella dallaii TaxID=48710 RepID=A0ABP1QQ52_9HEXA
MEVIGEAKEFLVPLAPLKSLLESNSDLKFSEDKKSDLDYMVYGKVYLLKVMGIADRSGASGGDNSKENSVRINEAASRIRSIQSPTFDSISESSEPYHDAIAFPQPILPTKRPYRFERKNKPYSQELAVGGNKFAHSSIRKLEERSAPATTEATGTSAIEIPSTHVEKASNEGEQNDSTQSNLDEEDLELIQTQYPIQTTTNGFSKTETNTHEVTPETKALNESNGNFTFEDRFLINVPSKPNINSCPDGQVRNHRGICKPIISHNPSPQDGFFEGRITTGISSRQKISRLSPSTSRSNLQLTTLFRYITNKEKYELDRIRIISEAEKQSKSQLDMGQGNAEGSTSPTAENSN